MNPSTTAIILIGFQGDYFSTDGILHDLLEDSAGTREPCLPTPSACSSHCGTAR